MSTECRPLLRTTFGWLEGHCLSSSEGDDGTNGLQNSPPRMGHCWDDAPPLSYLSGRINFPKLFVKAPMERFFTKNFNMLLVSTVGLCWAFLFVPLNEQGMVMEGERI